MFELEDMSIDHLEMEVLPTDGKWMIMPEFLTDDESDDELLDALHCLLPDEARPSSEESAPEQNILTSFEETILRDLACSIESPTPVRNPSLRRLPQALNHVYDKCDVISTDRFLTCVREVLQSRDFDCLVALSARHEEMYAGMHHLQNHAPRKGTSGFLRFVRKTFPSLRDAPGWTGGPQYVTCLTASVFFLLTTELIKREARSGRNKHAHAFLSMHCDRLLESPALAGDRYEVLRANLQRTCRFWSWMRLLLPIEDHIKEYLLVASCLEGMGKYHQRASKNPTKSYLSYRYLLEMLRGNSAVQDKDMLDSLRKALVIV